MKENLYGHTLSLINKDVDKKVVVSGASKTYPTALKGSAGGMGLGAPARSILEQPRSKRLWDPVEMQTSQLVVTGGDRLP